MALEKGDIQQIEKMFEKLQAGLRNEIKLSENRVKTELRKDIVLSEKRVKTELRKDIASSENRVKTELRKDIFNVEDKLTAKIEASENKVIAVITREVSDLAEVNHAVIKRLDKVDELEKRIVRIETKLGIT